MAARKKEESGLKSKKMELLIEQIWELFPNYCEHLDHIDLALEKLMPTINNRLKEANMTIIHSISIGFTKLASTLFDKNAMQWY